MPGAVGKRGAKQPSFVCYLCGHLYGGQRLLAHIIACEKKWMAAEVAKPKPRAFPDRPMELETGQLPTDAQDIDAFNARMFEKWQRLTMTACPNCGRTFKPEAFKRHSKACTQDAPGERVTLKKNLSFSDLAEHGKGDVATGKKVLRRSSMDAPRAYTCYLCGNQYGSKSFPLHIPRCQKLWEAREAKKACKKDRRPLPQEPMELSDPLPVTSAEIDQFNKRMFEYWSELAPMLCEKCGHSFKPEAFETHRRVCTHNSPNTCQYERSNNDPLALRKVTMHREGLPPCGRKADRWAAAQKMPRLYMCYLCGRQYDSKSFHNHVNLCRRMWDDREGLKPNEEDRRPAPQPPSELSEPLPQDLDDIDEFNLKMFEYWELNSLIGCEICGHSFTSEEFEVHQRVCTIDSPGGPTRSRADGPPALGKSLSPPSSAQGVINGTPKQRECYLCGDILDRKSLTLHILHCRKLWEDRESLKHPWERMPLPDPPPDLLDVLPADILLAGALSDETFDHMGEAPLIACPICAGTFTEDEFKSHRKVCTHGKPGGPHGLKAKTNAHKGSTSPELPSNRGAGMAASDGVVLIGRMPRAYMCYLCGHQYGSMSLPLHLPRCRKIWEQREALKPKQERRPVPEPPAELSDPLPSTPEGIDRFNHVMADAWHNGSLITCQICDRTFRAEAYRSHKKVCTPHNPGGPLGLKKGTASPARKRPHSTTAPAHLSTSGPKLYTCYLCKQQYASKSLDKHIPRCQRLWEEREALKPDENDRQPVPEPPPEMLRPLPTQPSKIAEFNDKMYTYLD